MHVALIEDLQKEILETSVAPRQSEPSGLLLGRGNEGAAIVSGYASQLGLNFLRDKEKFWEEFEPSLQKQAGQLQVLGYYRLASGAEPVPDECDLRVMREFLPESASTLLLIGTSPGNKAGALFIWAERDRQQLLVSKTKVQFHNDRGTKPVSREDVSQSSEKIAPSEANKPLIQALWINKSMAIKILRTLPFRLPEGTYSNERMRRFKYTIGV